MNHQLAREGYKKKKNANLFVHHFTCRSVGVRNKKCKKKQKGNYQMQITVEKQKDNESGCSLLSLHEMYNFLHFTVDLLLICKLQVFSANFMFIFTSSTMLRISTSISV